MVNYIEETEKFIKKRNNGEFVFTPIATKLWYPYRRPPHTSAMIEYKYRRLLADCLATAISEYEENTQAPQKLPLAKHCYMWIGIAWSTGALKEGEGLSRQLDECRKEKENIQKELETLSAEYQRLQNQLRAMRIRFKLESEDEGREKHR